MILRRQFLTMTPAILGLATGSRLLAGSAQFSKSILQYGASPDGRALSTKAIQSAIDDVFKAGGGVVNVPAGTFLTGRIELKSRVSLNLEVGSTLLGSTSISDYGSNTGASRTGGANPWHLIFAANAEDVAITGSGRIDGQGSAFWESSGKVPLGADEQWADFASRYLAPKKTGRPSPMLEFVNCPGLRVDGVHIANAPGWTMRVVNSDDVKIHNISIKNPVVGPNTDGIDITGCQNVLVSDCTIDTGDDAICLKSENPYGPEPRLIKNVVVTNCVLTTCCNGFKLGTSSEGGFENITFSDSKIVNAQVDFKNRVIAGIALEVVDGGWIDGVKVSGIQMQRTRTPLFIRLGDRKASHNPAQHGLRNVHIEDIHASEALLASSITGLAGVEVRDVQIDHMEVQNVLPGRPDWAARSVPEKESAYPEARMFGMLPASGLYVRHVRNLQLNDLAFTAPPGEPRSTVILDDVSNVVIKELKSSPVSGGKPILQKFGTKDVQISRLGMPGMDTQPLCS